MNIPSNKDLFTWSSPVNRYNYVSQLLPQNQSSANSVTPAIPGNTTNNTYNNYSYFASQKVADDFKELGNIAQTLNLGKKGNIFETTGATATSDNADAVTVKAANGAVRGTYNLQVNQIAKAQENAGGWTDAKAKTLGVDGNQGFNITVADQKGYTQKSANISLQTKTSQTNKEVLGLAAEAINKQNKELGVQARVESRTVIGVEQARLVVAGAKTGTNAGSFTINDTTGNLTAKTGVNKVTTVAQNAKYTINGSARESQSNEVTIDRLGQVKATLKSITKDAIKIEAQAQDTGTITNQVKDFIKQYNQTVKDLATPENRLSANMHQNFGLSQINAADRGKLATMGITVNANHTLDFNENRFKTALSYNPDQIRESLGGANGFAAKIEEKTAKIDLANNPITQQLNQINQNTLNNYFPGKYFNYFL